MNYKQCSHPYTDPTHVFKQFPAQKSCAFLHSGIKQHYAGKYSVHAVFPKETISGDTFTKLEPIFKERNTLTDYFSGGWIGYFSYDLKHDLETLHKERKQHIQTDGLCFIRFGIYHFFNNDTQTSHIAYETEDDLKKYLSSLNKTSSEDPSVPHIRNVHSNFTKESYLNAVEKVKDYIYEGDIFEANLTRKFFGEFQSPVNGKSLFLTLLKQSPSQYSAFIKIETLEIVSSSPERFIKIKNRRINSKPIKGTRPRGTTVEEDERIITELHSSEKDRAENLMIVDLVRNDIGKIAEVGSVHVPDLFKVETYQTVHQLVSTIEGKIAETSTILDAIKSCFPPGSMTGAPKIRAMEICTEIEDYTRGIYSGAIGYIGFDGYVDLSVVIRTLLIKNNQFEFQVGGAIVADSDAESEYQETLDKAKAICKVLNISVE